MVIKFIIKINKAFLQKFSRNIFRSVIKIIYVCTHANAHIHNLNEIKIDVHVVKANFPFCLTTTLG